jgi:hypothetical protein
MLTGLAFEVSSAVKGVGVVAHINGFMVSYETQ